MCDHLYQLLERCLQDQWAAVWDVPQDEEGKDLGHMVPPAGKVGNDVLERVESGADQLVIHVDGQARQEVDKVIPRHVGRHYAWDGCNTGFQQVQLGLHWAVTNKGEDRLTVDSLHNSTSRTSSGPPYIRERRDLQWLSTQQVDPSTGRTSSGPPLYKSLY